MRVLIVKVGAMGDVLHALPAVAALRRARPDWGIDWVVDERWRALLRGDGAGPAVDEVFEAPVRAWKAKPFSRATMRSVMGFWGLKGRYDVVVDMQGTLRSAVIGRMAGGGRLVGFADPREGLAGSFYGKKVQRRGAHVVEQGVNLLGEACGVELRPEVVALPREGWAEGWAETEAVLARPMALLAVGGGWGAKMWPVEGFGELAVELRGMGFDVVVNAARKEDARGPRVVEASGGACRVVVCNVAGLVALLRRTDLVVGGDSGPVHLAAAMGVPVVAVFGPTDPKRNGPWGPGVSVVVRDEGSVTSYKRAEEVEAGLGRVTVGRVVAAVLEVVGAR